MLVIEHLYKEYAGGVRALEDVSLEVRDGEFVVLIGLSGSGKSTLLRCVNRLVEPSGGRIMLDDTDITGARGSELPRIRRSIGMIFQQFNLVKRSSVLTNGLARRLRLEAAGHARPRRRGGLTTSTRQPGSRRPARLGPPARGWATRRPAAARGDRSSAHAGAETHARRRAGGQSRSSYVALGIE